MKRKLKKVHGLLARFQFVDLAKAIDVPMGKRKEYLRTYLERALSTTGRMASYEHFRRAIPDIYGVARPLDTHGPLSLEQVLRTIRTNCHSDDVNRNTEVAELLHEFVSPRDYRAFEHPAHDLSISTTRKVQIRVNHYVVDDDRGVFQFVYPRREALAGNQLALMGSLIHHNYVFGDHEGFDVEIVDLSCPDFVGPRGGRRSGELREPRIHLISQNEIVSRAELQPDVQSVHDLLLEIGEEV